MISLYRINSQSYNFSYWRKKNKFKKEDLFFSGRQALFSILDYVKKNKRIEKVFIPSYLPEGVIEPIKKSKIDYVFYKLDVKLNPSIDFLESKLKKKNLLFIFIHYFGFYYKNYKLNKLLSKKNITVLHDLAQAPFLKISDIKINKDDYFLYSFNKSFPITDGSFVKTNKKLNIKKIKIDKKLSYALNFYDSHLHLGKKIFDLKNSKNFKKIINKHAYFYDKYYSIIKSNFSNYQISNTSFNLLNQINFKKFKNQRMKNSRYIYENIKNPNIKFLHNKLNKFSQPWCIPLLVKKRDKILNTLKRKNILAGKITQRWNFIPNNRNYKNEKNFFKNHILIPNNEFLKKKEISNLIEGVNKI